MRKSFFFLIASCFIFFACTPEVTTTPEIGTMVAPPVRVTPTVELESTPLAEPYETPVTLATPISIKAKDLRNIRVHFWHPWIQDTEHAIRDLVDRFNAENEYGITVEAESHSIDLSQDVRVGINRGDFPVLVVASNYDLQSWDYDDHFVVDLEGYLSDPEWGLPGSLVTDFDPLVWQQDVFRGKRLGIPVYRSGTVLLYNRSWAQDLGFDSAPLTPEAFKKQACAAAAATPASLENPGVGGWIASFDPGTVMTWVMAFGDDGLNLAGDGYQFNSPDTVAAFEFIRGLFTSGCAWLPEGAYAWDLFANRQGLFYSTTISGVGAQELVDEKGQNIDEWVVIPYPAPDGFPVINLYGPAYAILNGTPREQLAAWVFIRWLLQAENQARLVESGGYFPTGQPTSAWLKDYAKGNPKWFAALDLVSYGHPEPVFGSWSVGRWALSDVAMELAHENLSAQEIPLILEDLDALLAEIHAQKR